MTFTIFIETKDGELVLQPDVASLEAAEALATKLVDPLARERDRIFVRDESSGDRFRFDTTRGCLVLENPARRRT